MKKVKWKRLPFVAVIYCATFSDDQTRKVLGSLNISTYEDKQDADAATISFECSGSQAHVVHFKVNLKECDMAELAGICSHEAAHIKQSYMDFIGDKNPSEEFEAYVVQIITRDLMKACVKQKGKIHGKKH